MDRTEIRKDLKNRLSKKRFEHTIGVMYTAGAMAMRYGIAPRLCQVFIRQGKIGSM